eukprot:GABW01005106.1.p3 GENE.GABW01005106.1~~GABW01005106.1.p3  ORF type:complete len:53 (-),score=1.30 GABW01005106.1:193-351(-)
MLPTERILLEIKRSPLALFSSLRDLVHCSGTGLVELAGAGAGAFLGQLVAGR